MSPADSSASSPAEPTDPAGSPAGPAGRRVRPGIVLIFLILFLGPTLFFYALWSQQSWSSYKRSPRRPSFDPRRMPQNLPDKKKKSSGPSSGAPQVTPPAETPDDRIAPTPRVTVVYALFTTLPPGEVDRLTERISLLERLQTALGDAVITKAGEMLLSYCEDPQRLLIERHRRDELPFKPELAAGPLGRGITRAQIEKLRWARQVVIIRTEDRNTPLRFGLLAAQFAATELARSLDGIALDVATQEYFSHASLRERIVQPNRLVVARHILTLSRPQKDGRHFIATYGMVKFGMPEIVLRNCPAHSLELGRRLVHGIAHRMVELTTLKPDGDRQPACPRELLVRLADVAAAVGIEPAGEPPEKVQGRCEVFLADDDAGLRDPSGGEPRMRVRIRSARGAKDDEDEWLRGRLKALFGAGTDPIVAEGDPKDFEAVRAAAQKTLPGVKERFGEGLAEGLTLKVRCGFATPGGRREYIWFAVEKWKGSLLEGRVASRAALRRDIHPGLRLRIRETDVQDWLIRYPSGAVEGFYSAQQRPTPAAPTPAAPIRPQAPQAQTQQKKP